MTYIQAEKIEKCDFQFENFILNGQKIRTLILIHKALLIKFADFFVFLTFYRKICTRGNGETFVT